MRPSDLRFARIRRGAPALAIAHAARALAIARAARALAIARAARAFVMALAPAMALPLLAASGCAIPLDEPREIAPPPPEPSPLVAPGCLLFHASAPDPPVSMLDGPGRSMELASGDSLWLFDSAATPGGAVSAPGALVASGASSAGCFAATPFQGVDTPAPRIDTSALGAGRFVMPLDGARLGDVSVLYVSVLEYAAGEPFGVRAEGIGVAAWEPETGLFVVKSPLLWTADRPSYGSSVLAEGEWLYVYGCKSRSGTLAADCFLARAAQDRFDDGTAYQYFVGGGGWVETIDDAAPIVAAGPSASVRHYPDRGRYLMSVITTLGDTIELRTGLGPEGPWSGPVRVATCAIPDDPGAFCAGAVQHPEVTGASSTIALSYAIPSLSSDAGARRAAAPESYWPRLVLLPWPEELP
jgi:hypothetical protein